MINFGISGYGDKDENGVITYFKIKSIDLI